MKLLESCWSDALIRGEQCAKESKNKILLCRLDSSSFIIKLSNSFRLLLIFSFILFFLFLLFSSFCWHLFLLCLVVLAVLLLSLPQNPLLTAWRERERSERETFSFISRNDSYASQVAFYAHFSSSWPGLRQPQVAQVDANGNGNGNGNGNAIKLILFMRTLFRAKN